MIKIKSAYIDETNKSHLTEYDKLVLGRKSSAFIKDKTAINLNMS